MPLVKYFVVTGLALVGLLFVADALLSRPENPIYAAKFDGISQPGSRGTVMSRELALPPPPVAAAPAEPPAVAATAPVVPAAQPQPEASPPADAAKTRITAKEITAKEQPAKKRHHLAQRAARPRVVNENDYERPERWDRPSQHRRRAPWDDDFAFAPRNGGPFWFR